MKYSGAEITIKLLERHGIEIIAGIPGGSNLPLYNALYKSSIRHILSRHEQGAGFIAQGIARSTGKTAVCFATSGPGATNLITAIADAKLDSVPVIAITGQVPLSMIGTDAFQEVDTFGITLPITKHNYIVRSAEELMTIIPDAFRIAGSGRPGPVVIDIPKNVQLEELDVTGWPEVENTKIYFKIDDREIREASDMICFSKKPILYIGGGVINSNAHALIKELAEKNSIPIASTLMGLGAIPTENPLYLGMLGMHGFHYTNHIMEEADLILAFGVRFDDRATGDVKNFCRHAGIIHIDIDHAEIDKIKKSSLAINGDIGDVLKRILPFIQYNDRKEWVSHIAEMKLKYPLKFPRGLWHPISVIREINRIAGEDSIFTTDVGQHQMWAAQALQLNRPRALLTSGGLGTMGFGLPAAIGAALANPAKNVICLSGDGSIMMNIQELATLAELNLNVKVIVMNNGHLGLVRQQQELFYGKNYIASRFERNPDLKTIASGFGLKSYHLEYGSSLAPLANILSADGPAFINIEINPEENIFPMVPPGKANYEMIGEYI